MQKVGLFGTKFVPNGDCAFLAVFYKTLHTIFLSMELYYYFNGIEGAIIQGWFIQTHLI